MPGLDIRNTAALPWLTLRSWLSRLIFARWRLSVIGSILPSHDLDPTLAMTVVQSPLHDRSRQVTPSQLQRL